MINLAIAYFLIVLVLLGYSASPYRRARAVEQSIRAWDEASREQQ